MTSQPCPPTLLHLGCGRASEWQDTGFPARFARIVLVEPDPSCHDALQDLARADRRITVIPAAAADHDGEAALRVMSFRDMTGFVPVAGLRHLLPGLREDASIAVRGLTPATLLSEAGLTGPAAPPDAGPDAHADIGAPPGHTLILETLGHEGATLKGLADCGALAWFDTVRVTLPHLPPAAGVPDSSGVPALLAAHGLILMPGTADDPDFPQLTFRRAPVSAADAGTDADTDIGTDIGAVPAQDPAPTDTAAVSATEPANRATTGAWADPDMAARIALLETDLAASDRALALARGNQVALSAALDAAYAALRQAGITPPPLPDVAFPDLAPTVHAVTAPAPAPVPPAAPTPAPASPAQETALAEAKAALVALTQDLAARDSALETARSDLRVALRLQALAAADLRDLQARHAAAVAERAARDDLIAQLAQRLEEAANHLQALGPVTADAGAPLAGPVAADLPRPSPQASPQGDSPKDATGRGGKRRKSGKSA